MTIPELIEKLEKATGPDRDLDEAISAALFPQHEFMQLKDAPEGVGSMMYRWPNGQQVSALRATSSIDAAVKLCELVLGRLDLLEMTFQIGGKYHHCRIETEHGDAEAFNMPTLPLALCIAILRALQPKEGE